MYRIFIFFIVSIISFSGLSQSIYLKPNIELGIAISKKYNTIRSVDYYETNTTSNLSYSYESTKYSFGYGFNWGLTVGAELNENLDFGISFGYNISKSPELMAYSIYKFDYIDEPLATARVTELINNDCKLFHFTPELTIKIPNKNLRFLDPYIKVGAIIGFSSIIQDYQLSAIVSGSGYYPFESTAHKLKYDLTNSIGFKTSIGTEYNIQDELIVFAELSYFNLNISPKSAQKIESSYMSQDNLDDLTVNDTYYEYVDKYQEVENNNTETPTKKMPVVFSHNNLDIAIGVKFYIY